MSCDPKFVKEIDWDCVKELIAHVRSGKVSVCCLEKGLWIAGCALSLFSKDDSVPVPVPVPFGESVEADRSLEGLCDAIEASVPVEGAIQGPASLDPATVLMIIQLVWKLVQAFKK